MTGTIFAHLRPSPVDLKIYSDAPIARFSGDTMRETVNRVLADSLVKLPDSMGLTIRERTARGLG